MRDIRFRVWDKELKKIFPVESAEFINKGWITQLEEDNKLRTVRWDRVELMQYTGLKDKNGKEIYELDSLERGGQIGEVRWDEVEARFRIYCYQAEPVPCNYPVSSDWEIKGNIYESNTKI